MKVLVVGVGSNPGGIEAFMRNYTARMSKEISFDFFATEKDFCDRQLYEKRGSQVYCLRSSQFRQAGKYRQELREFFELHQGEYDAIWLNSGDLVNIMPIAKMARRYKINRIIIHAHSNNIINTGKKYYFYRMWHGYYRHTVKRVVTDYWACSKEAGEFFFTGSVRKSKNYHIISNAIDSAKYVYNAHTRQNYREKLGVEGKVVIGHIGGFFFQKNQSFLVDIFEQLYSHNKDYQLCMVGQGKDMPLIREKVERLGLSDRVIFTGARSDVADLLQAMDLFVFPSLFEGLGMALIEAQVSGLKCFASKDVIPEQADISGLVEFIDIGKTAAQWAEIIRNTEIETDRAAYGQCAVLSGYDIGHEAGKLEKLLLDAPLAKKV